MPRFCPRCGGLLRPHKEGDKIVLVCSRCGYKVEASPKDLNSYKLSVKITHTEKEKTIVVTGEKTEGLPITREVVCPRCGHNEAYYWMIQTRAADEPPTRFFRCTKCGYTWREYD